MSTRSLICFMLNRQPLAKVYNHNGGHPDIILPDLRKFFNRVKRQNPLELHNIFNPATLAAKYIIWAAQRASKIEQLVKKKSWAGKFRFSGLGIVLEDPKDINYIYHVHCDQLERRYLPTIAVIARNI